jgi:hypothetical protein
MHKVLGSIPATAHTKKRLSKSGMVAHIYNLRTWEAKAGELLNFRPIWAYVARSKPVET